MKKKIIIILSIIAFLFISLFLYARFVGTKGLKVKEYRINASITDNFHGLKIVHFSDLHFGMTTYEKELDNLVNKINFIKPDIVVFTGDLINKNESITDEIKKIIIDKLSLISVSLSKYCVSGNHDNEIYLDIMKQSGFISLNNTYELIYKGNNSPILIAGVTSNIIDTTSMDDKLKTTYDYLSTNNIQYRILLMHEPDYIDNIKENTFNLVLSGHSHGGQVKIPFMDDLVKVNGAKKYYDDYYEINNTKLYISSGIGTTWFKLRLFNKPSFNFYRITKES